METNYFLIAVIVAVILVYTWAFWDIYSVHKTSKQLDAVLDIVRDLSRKAEVEDSVEGVQHALEILRTLTAVPFEDHYRAVRSFKEPAYLYQEPARSILLQRHLHA